ncbi:MAG: hypothetical protein J7K14_05590 [Sulfurimonas sp.]|nr:hypothetical protein [Sulfurimonas sp.]
MLKKIILLFTLLLLFTSCSSDYDKRLKISATTWVGYIPLFYAKEKGWLKPLNIKLLHVSSLAENMYLYEAGNSDAYTGTQYEYSMLSKNMKSLKPIMMLDRSNGGDLVMGNLSVEDLQNTTSQIDAYLELDSVNNTVLKDFLSKYKLEDKNINYINRDQVVIKQMQADSKPTLIVTYVPYNFALEKQGFMELASTKDSLDLLVVDALFTRTETYDAHQKQFSELKKLVDKSIESLKKDPKEFYATVKPYILDMSYDEFVNSLDDIVWINRDISPALKQRMNQAKFPIRDLM